MKKICLLFVLSIVSVFSTSAQINDQSTDKIGTAENVKVLPQSADSGSEAAKTTVKISETSVPEEAKLQTADKQNIQTEAPRTGVSEAVKKPQVSETVKKSENIAAVKKTEEKEQPKSELPVLAAKKTLGGLSTGNAMVDGYIEEFSALYNVDPLLIYAQMNQESSFKARATSPKGASGFMQLMPDTARRFGVTNIYNPKQNIKAGIKYMRWLLDKFGGDARLALAGYNAGEGSVMKYGNKVPPYRETQNYVAKIMNHYEQITNQPSTLASNEK